MADNLYFDFDIDSSQLERLRQAIEVSGTSKSFDTQLKISMGVILRRVKEGIKSTAANEVPNKYCITEKRFSKYTKVSSHNAKNLINDRVLKSELIFKGYKIPLVKFDVPGTYHKHKRKINDVVSKCILIEKGKTTFRHAFYAKSKILNRIAVFAREEDNTDRLPIAELMGPSGAQMIDDDEITDKIAEKAAVTFENRLDHEIERIMNGWGV